MRKENMNIENDLEIEEINRELRELGKNIKAPRRLRADVLVEKAGSEETEKVPSIKFSFAAAVCGLMIICAVIALQPLFKEKSGGNLNLSYGSSGAAGESEKGPGSSVENAPETDSGGLDEEESEAVGDIVKVKNFEELETAIDSIKYSFAHVISQLGWSGPTPESSSESVESSSAQDSYKLPGSVTEEQKKNKVQYGKYTIFSCSLPGRDEDICVQNSKGKLVAGFSVKGGMVKEIKIEDENLIVIYEAYKEEKLIKTAFEETGIIFVDISDAKNPKQTGKYVQEGKYIEVYDNGYGSFLVTKRFAVSGLEAGDRSYRLRYINNGKEEGFEPGNIYLHYEMMSLDYVVVSELKAGGKTLALLGGSDVKADANYLVKRMWRN